MPIPESERVFFDNNPLARVICQLSFPPILSIASEDPAEFQDEIRGAYPNYHRDKPVIESERVTDLLTELGVISGSEHITHKFLTDDEQRQISLAREFVAVTEHDYRRWEDFREEVDRMRAAVEEIYEPNYYKRVGLRYTDVIDREELGLGDVDWTELLNDALLGLLSQNALRREVVSTKSESEIRLEELEGAQIKLRHGLVEGDESGHMVYLIDTDCYLEGNLGGDDADAILDRFNRAAGNLFRWAISDRLEGALDPRPMGVGGG